MKNQYLLRQRFLIRFPWNSPAVLRIVPALSREFLEGALIWHPNKHALCIYLYTKYTYTLSHTHTLSYTHPYIQTVCYLWFKVEPREARLRWKVWWKVFTINLTSLVQVYDFYMLISRWVSILNNHLQEGIWDFSGGLGVRNPPANTVDIGLIPSPGRSHMLWSS